MVPVSGKPLRPTFASGVLSGKILRQCREAMAIKEQFFVENAERIADCCQAMARSFDEGGRLLVMGNGPSSCDAAHLAVEFTHPVIETRPPLPALSLAADAAFLTAVGNGRDFSLAFLEQIELLGRPGDIALGISASGRSANVVRGLQAAQRMNLLTVGFSGRDGGRFPTVCDYCFTVPSYSTAHIRETHGMLLHIIWDLVHVIRGEEEVI